ncbi:MAG: DUF45 domain-containing protein [Sulfurospirillaceae bacterium]|jgi:predicted metal-dependent hydrolase|nr:DUF45 domain-containing protein [Sulfurospirillaceae bacterium]MDD2827288.1 DUF45 domain-containing protein [Sulfurospirillaceae bacterium]
MTTAYVEYQGQMLPYTIITNKKLKNLYISVDPHKGVIVKNPNYAISKVETIVRQKAGWIFQKIQQAQKRYSIPKLLEEGKILYLGDVIPLHATQKAEAFYKEHTKRLIPQIVEEQSFLMGVTPLSISYRKAKKRWGSCSYKNELSFNITLAQLPLECITYIVIHELSHIKHKHHKKAFWDCVAEYMPEYKICERRIKEFLPSL